MIRQPAFENASKHLKGALHCHTTRSDGAMDPADVMRLHKENGYDFMAVTDHRRYNFVSFAPETGITVIPGTELDRNLPGPGIHCHHIVCIGPEKADGNGFEQDQTFDRANITTQAECQELIDMVHANNNMTIYCHPEWSGVTAREFENLEGNFAMEIWNSGGAIEFNLDTNAAYWDELLAQGKMIWGVATDDGHARHHHCKGWVMVNAENNVNAILEALKNGAFYSSCGPEIYDFYVERDAETQKLMAHVKCSPVKEIQFVHLRVPYRLTKAAEGEFITEAKIDVWATEYVRAVVTDAEGRRAWTNPIFYRKPAAK